MEIKANFTLNYLINPANRGYFIMESGTLKHLYDQLKNNWHFFPNSKVRDLTKIDLNNNYSLIVAVDSDGGIGNLEGDTVKCDPYQLGRFAMRVPLMEILSSGALPIAAFDMLTIPMKGPGEEIVHGVRDELARAGLGKDFPLSGSTEDNVPTVMTGIGTTIIGIVHENDFRPGSAQNGDIIICIGVPKSAPEDRVLLDDIDIINQNDIIELLKIPEAHDILPVGSRGVSYEAGEMARSAGLNISQYDNPKIDVEKSAGPSTCAIISCSQSIKNKLQEIIHVPISLIGELEL